jgi:hypothetical protein
MAYVSGRIAKIAPDAVRLETRQPSSASAERRWSFRPKSRSRELASHLAVCAVVAAIYGRLRNEANSRLLLPDEGGTVGRAGVSNQAGSVELVEARSAAVVEKGRAPQLVSPVGRRRQAEIRRDAGRPAGRADSLHGLLPVRLRHADGRIEARWSRNPGDGQGAVGA